MDKHDASSTPFDRYADYIYRDDVLARLDALQAIPDADRDEDEQSEMEMLEDAETELRGCRDGSLIAEHAFTDYAQEFARDIHGADAVDGAWPFGSIDWEDAADQLKQDYTAIEIGGMTFYALQ